jgi:hypothetical protein
MSTSPGVVRTPSTVLHFSCVHDSFVGIVAGLRFGRYLDRRGPPHRVCAADIATAASTGVDPHPRSEPRTDNPHPLPDGTSRNSHFPRKRSPGPRRRLILVFPEPSLGLGRISRYFEGRTRSGGKRSTSETPGATGGPATAVQADGRDAGHGCGLNLPNASHGK